MPPVHEAIAPTAPKPIKHQLSGGFRRLANALSSPYSIMIGSASG